MPGAPLTQLDNGAFQAKVINTAAIWAAFIQDTNNPPGHRFLCRYYDGARIWYQINDWLDTTAYNNAAAAANQVYLDYLIPNGYGAAGYDNFPDGLYENYLRTGRAESLTALHELEQHHSYHSSAEWADDTGEPSPLTNVAGSREAAYALRTKYVAQDSGATISGSELAFFVAKVKTHFDRWFISQTSNYVRPFMVALSAEALITHWEHTADTEVQPLIQAAADYLWTNCWLPGNQCMKYTDRPDPDGSHQGGEQPAPEEGNLVALLYGWLFDRTGNTVERDRGDALFNGVVNGATPDAWWEGNTGKNFNQILRNTFKYLELTGRIEVSPPPPGTLFWTLDTNPFWSLQSVVGEGWLPWPGRLFDASRQVYEFRVVTQPGGVPGVIDRYLIKLDAPDITEKFSDFVIASGGTRLPITKSYRAIRHVGVTLVNTGGAALIVTVEDKGTGGPPLTAGPLLKCRNASLTPVAGTVDAEVIGY